ncbi:MacB-like periplasmic core domain [Vibrio sp. B1FLJ16]|nr:MacB-like periplasmic core domain [Vibrio sp. B1FLJ16]CAE6938116.1 MacB-like periplasmic core domain [Vibrio sp. B1FLJ16]
MQIHQSEYLINPEIKEIIPNSDVIATTLANQLDVKAVSERFLADGMIASARSTRGIRINGINIEQEGRITPLARHIQQGEWLNEEGKNPLLVSQKTAQRLKLRIGSKVILTLSDIKGDVSGAAFRVRGIFKTPSTTFDDRNVYVRKADLEKIAGLVGAHEISILLKSNDENVLEQTRAFTQSLLSQSIGDQLVVRKWLEIQPLLSTMMSSMNISNQVMLVVFVLALTLGIINIMLMSVFERTREFGVLMAVGMQQHKIRTLIILETLFLGLSGCALGLLGSAVMLKILSITGLSLSGLADGLGAYGVDTLLFPRVSFSEYRMIIVAIFVASLFAALYPARQILKHRPVDAMAEKT